MKVRTREDIEALKDALNHCTRSVWVEAQDGRKYVLTDKVGVYAGIGALLEDRDEELELYTADRRDECVMLDFLQRHCA